MSEDNQRETDNSPPEATNNRGGKSGPSRFERGVGVTPTERYLARLCSRSFLRLWSYPGVYRNQPSAPGNTQGKEVCDLLVAFDEHVIIFSDKDCEYKPELGAELAWSRWVRKAIFKSADQVFGAERWLKEKPHRLFTDKECKCPFPIQLPAPGRMRVHRVVVAHGISGHCRKEVGDDVGSLMITNSLRGQTEHERAPFWIGQIAPDKGYVHVFDDATLEIMLTTLDTISDFVAYLDKKEKLLTGDLRVSAAGEEELLGWYFKDLNEAQEHDFIVPQEYNALSIDKGFWRDFCNSGQRRSQIRANERSYFWDSLIEKFVFHAVTGTQREATSTDLSEQEILFRWMAREPRTRRRMLSEALLGLAFETPVTHRATRIIKPSLPGDPFYLFLVVPWYSDVSEEDYRFVRKELLVTSCHVLKVKYPEAEQVIGIATETGRDPTTRSEDAVHLDLREWTPELELEARRAQRDLDILTHTTETRRVAREFPEASYETAPLGGPRSTSRNAKCPCGSGMRYRKCCAKQHFQKKLTKKSTRGPSS